MKHIPYRQNPTVIDTSKSPPTTGENYACIYELSNHLNTAYNTYAPVRAFRTGAFCCSQKIFEEIYIQFSVISVRTIYIRVVYQRKWLHT